MSTIGKKLKKLLKESDVKQVTLANAVGISPSRLSNYLSDKREPDLEMLARMAKVLKVDVNYFADMKSVTYPVVKESIHTDSTETIEIPVKRLNAKKGSLASSSIQLDKKLINVDTSALIAIDVTLDIGNPLFSKGDYLIVTKEHTPKHGDILITMGRNCKAYRLWMYRDEPFIIDSEGKELLKLADIKDVEFYTVLLIIRRAKND